MSNISKSKSQYKRPRNYFMIDHRVLDHPDFLNLNWAAQALLIHMCRLYNGFNNGDISIALSDMASKGWSKGTLERAKKDLLKCGWIIMTRQGGKNCCCLYAIGWVPIDNCIGKFDSDITAYKLKPLQ